MFYCVKIYSLLKSVHGSSRIPSRAILLLVSIFSYSVHASIDESVTIDELIDFVSKEGSNAIEYYAASEVKKNIANSEFVIEGGDLVDVNRYPDSDNSKISGTCIKIKYTDMESRTTLNNTSKFRMQANGIEKPILLKVSGDVTTSFSGRLHIEKGFGIQTFLFGSSCNWAGSVKVSKTIEASVNGSADMEMEIAVNPEKLVLNGDVIRYKISPTLKAGGKITNIGMPRFRVIHGGVAGDVVNKLNDMFYNAADNLVWDASLISYIVERLATDKLLKEKIEQREAKFTQAIAKAVLGADYSSWSQGDPIEKYFDMPEFGSVILEDSLEFIGAGISNYEHSFPISYDFLQQDNIRETLYNAIISGDRETVTTTLASSLACEYAMRSARPMSVDSTAVYTDVVTQGEFCSMLVGESARHLGNASDVIKSNWMLTPGTTLDVGVKSIKANYQPYMQRVRYKTVASKISGTRPGELQCSYNANGVAQYCFTPQVNVLYGDGACELEMRVYKKNPTATNLKPLMAIHGGSWRYRGFGFSGLESMISHFTDRGYVVFAPFYRLAGNSDGNIECNNANGKDIVADAESALDWVVANSKDYGATGKVLLFGQSAGAHLAGYLSTHRKDEIDRSWLMYPPTHFADYVRTWTQESNAQGTQAISGFLSYLKFNSLSELSSSTDSFILDNSFPEIIKNNPDEFPPVLLMHGVKDTLLPVRQSKLMCDAYGGSGTYVSTSNGEHVYRGVTNCGSRGSKLYLFEQADHIFDLGCIDRDFSGGKLCPAGSYESERSIEASITEGLEWLEEVFDSNVDDSEGASESNCGKLYGNVWANDMSAEHPKIQNFCGACGFSTAAPTGYRGGGNPNLTITCKH